METLTGRKRVREQKRLFRSSVYVLQVEVRHHGVSLVSYGAHLEREPYDFTKWRDAQPEDCVFLGNQK